MIFIGILILASTNLYAQVKIKGVVYDNSALLPLPSVSVLSNSGKGTITRDNGSFETELALTDSLWFSYLNKQTMKFPVAEIRDPANFELAIHVNIPVMKEVIVQPANYRLDSIQNRIDYAKVFNYQRPTISSIVKSISITGISIDINELIRAFQFRKIRSMLKFQERLILQEQEKFIDRHFNKAFVCRITSLQGDQLQKFMLLYRPTYEFVLSSSEYELGEFIHEAYKISTLCSGLEQKAMQLLPLQINEKKNE